MMLMELNKRRSVCFLFFFSSRRRHTRSLCDWSSDVCSSDLSLLQRAESLQHRVRLFSTDVDANIRVQQEARLHNSPLRFCGLSFFRPGSVKSAGNAASKSNARAWGGWQAFYGTALHLPGNPWIGADELPLRATGQN